VEKKARKLTYREEDKYTVRLRRGEGEPLAKQL
jgi:hypothetical protein